jgi:hypothetical protein
LLEKNTPFYYVINNLEREFNFSGSLKMDIVKMSPLTLLMAEKRERRNEEKKKLTLLPSPALLRALILFFSFSLMLMYGNDERSKNTIIENIVG